jgi:hypothetical protein
MHPLVRALATLRFEHCFNPYAERCPVPVLPVRHPSHGGRSQFIAQVAALYGMRRH